MSLSTRSLTYQADGATLEAVIALPEGAGKRPAVLVAHQWGGRDAFSEGHARRLAEAGYVGVALDMYGKGVHGNSVEENSALMTPFMENRAKVRERMQAALALARQQPEVDAGRVAAIGFCFGGLCVLDLARSGADLRGVVSFHGLLKPSGLDAQAIQAKVLVLHGADDPLAPIEDVVALREELNAAGCDWQLHMYGRAQHAFAVPGANVPDIGAHHNADAERRSMASCAAFLAEVLA
jgi:dienelactone hydrolase